MFTQMGARLFIHTGEEMKIVAIIPARKGSKRLPNKNLRCFNGIPLIEVTINQALESGIFSDIYITTDIDEYVGKQGVITRPECLANDTATSEDVVLHALWSMPILPDAFVLLQPTSPLRSPEDFKEIARMIQNIHPRLAQAGVSYSSRNPKNRNGAFYAMKTDFFMNNRMLKNESYYPEYFMPSWTGKYIDCETDFIECERLYREHLLDAWPFDRR